MFAKVGKHRILSSLPMAATKRALATTVTFCQSNRGVFACVMWWHYLSQFSECRTSGSPHLVDCQFFCTLRSEAAATHSCMALARLGCNGIVADLTAAKMVNRSLYFIQNLASVHLLCVRNNFIVDTVGCNTCNKYVDF